MISRRGLFAFTSFSLLFAACGGEASDPESESSEQSRALGRAEKHAVFTQSNDSAGNTVLSYMIEPTGGLTFAGAHPTGGLGTSNGLGSQGALASSYGGRVLLAVNAGSNDLSSFTVHGADLLLRSRLPSGGMRPVSVAAKGPLVYVVNAGEPATVAAFRLRPSGELSMITGCVRPLSAAAAVPAQVGISPRGDAVVVTEKSTNLIDVFRIDSAGCLSRGEQVPSSGMTPFGFAFTPRGELVVSEAASASVSSYRFDFKGELRPVSAAVPDLQRAPCWVVTTSDSRFAYTANAGSASISGYRVDAHGRLTLLDSDGLTGAAGDNSHPLDMAIDSGRRLFLLDSGNHAISQFEIDHDGSLALTDSTAGLPMTAAGLVAN